MSIYWCGLQRGFVDEKSKKILEALTKEQIDITFDLHDSKVISEVLDELLKSEPVKQVRKKIDYSNPGSKNWKVGDVFAYPLSGKDVDEAELTGKYAIIYCHEIEKVTTRQNDIKIYIFLSDDASIKKPIDELLQTSIPVLSFAIHRYYQYLLCSSHHEYPTEKLTFLGNTQNFSHPIDEQMPPKWYAIPLMLWERFNEKVANDVGVMRRKTGMKAKMVDSSEDVL